MESRPDFYAEIGRFHHLKASWSVDGMLGAVKREQFRYCDFSVGCSSLRNSASMNASKRAIRRLVAISYSCKRQGVDRECRNQGNPKNRAALYRGRGLDSYLSAPIQHRRIDGPIRAVRKHRWLACVRSAALSFAFHHLFRSSHGDVEQEDGCARCGSACRSVDVCDVFT